MPLPCEQAARWVPEDPHVLHNWKHFRSRNVDLGAGERHLDLETCVRRLADQVGNLAVGGFCAKPILAPSGGCYN